MSQVRRASMISDETINLLTIDMHRLIEALGQADEDDEMELFRIIDRRIQRFIHAAAELLGTDVNTARSILR